MPGAGSPLLPPPASSPPSPTAGNSPLLLLPLAFAEIPEARFNGCVTEWPASSRWRRWRLGVFGELPATSLNGGVDGDELGADLAASTPPHRCGQEAHSGVDSVGSDGVGGEPDEGYGAGGRDEHGVRVAAAPSSSAAVHMGLLLWSDLAAPFPFSSSGWIARRGGTARRRHALHSAWATRFPRPCGLAEAKKRASLHGDKSLWWDTTRTDTRAFFRRGAGVLPHSWLWNTLNFLAVFEIASSRI
uniref:Uncharacterized protein n=1 Tax=Oryza sativa subsp. japonica TaxID=39947 RepID=Q6ZG13_ORYSJ|nr:hypothetical protein [Oryza sativa Japonica Group]BAC99476.1 hypothetical protein [Oryza sativa Japonica Group]